jgi:hypothetical protein
MHIGITGHQRLRDDRLWSWVARAIRHQISRVEPPLVGVTSLAIGADQLFARLILEVGGTIYAVLPFPDVERSFSPEEVPSYRDLVQNATTEILRTPGTDEDAYLAAGHRVVELSEALLAVWDGKPAKGRGGTADVVAYAVSRGVPMVHINPSLRTITIVD